MKILELAPYVFIEDHPYGKKNKSGLAYMIRSICDMISFNNDVRVLTQSIITSNLTIDRWLLVKRDFLSILLNFRFCYLLLALKLYYRDKSVQFFRRLLYCLSAGQAESIIKKWRPDIVHIHGISPYTIPYYLAASRSGAPVVSTLHGLISFHSIVPASDFSKKMERHFLDLCIDNGYSLTFISTGMKEKVEHLFKKKCPTITVIPNCFRTVNDNGFKIVDNRIKKLICVGSIYPLKNQIQVIRVLPEVQRRYNNLVTVQLDIYGDGVMMDEWKKYAQERGINNVFFYGRQSQNVVYSAITQADVLVFPSIEEGFGIPIVEAYSCGTPVVTFRDIDAASDIMNDDCCIFAKDRSDDSLVDAIVESLNREWEIDKIIAFSQNFTLESISKKYDEVMGKKHKIWTEKQVRSFIESTCNE